MIGRVNTRHAEPVAAHHIARPAETAGLASMRRRGRALNYSRTSKTEREVSSACVQHFRRRESCKRRLVASITLILYRHYLYTSPLSLYPIVSIAEILIPGLRRARFAYDAMILRKRQARALLSIVGVSPS